MTLPAGAATFGAGLSTHPSAADAVAEAVGQVVERVGRGPDAALVFASGPHRAAIGDIAATVSAVLSPVSMIGAGSSGVIGGDLEVEGEPAVAVWAGHVGDTITTRLTIERSGAVPVLRGLPREATVGRRPLLLLTEPGALAAGTLTTAIAAQAPGLTVVGGVAAGGTPGRLVADGVPVDDAAVGILLPEGDDALARVAQGCRPVGAPYVVTAAEGSTVRELGSRPAVDRLREAIAGASARDRELLTSGLHVGLAVDEAVETFGPGDFLVRAVVGTDHGDGSIRVGAPVTVGTTVQFHVRDAAAAAVDLDTTLAGVDADAALVFTSDDRGTALFGHPDHDAEAVSAVAGPAVAGMFCAAEFGPIRGRSHVHGGAMSALFLFG